MVPNLLIFSVYTCAMIGVIFLAFIVYKKATQGNFKTNSTNLKVEEAINLAPGKVIYVLRSKGERFLIASDPQRTTFLAKLDSSKEDIEREEFQQKVQAINSVYKEENLSEDDELDSTSPLTGLSNRPVMKELLRKLGK